MERNCWITVSTRDTSQSADSSGGSGCSFVPAVGIAVAVLSMGVFRSHIDEESSGLLIVAMFAAMFLGFLSMVLCGVGASPLFPDFCVFHDDRLVASEKMDRYASVQFEKEGDVYTVKWDDYSIDLKLSQGKYYVIRKDGSEWKCSEYSYRY